VYGNGIIILGVIAAVLVIAFQGSTHALIPLFAVGVFICFTLSQAGMAHLWWTRRGPAWLQKLLVNGLGALTTGIATLVVASTKPRRASGVRQYPLKLSTRRTGPSSAN
jgi:hypothetical protein